MIEYISTTHGLLGYFVVVGDLDEGFFDGMSTLVVLDGLVVGTEGVGVGVLSVEGAGVTTDGEGVSGGGRLPEDRTLLVKALSSPEI